MAFNCHEHLQRMNELLVGQTPFVAVTMVDARGSAPQIQGAKAIITESGIVQGTLGGGKVEAKAIQHAQAMLQRDDGTACELTTWNLQTDVGMTCGGEVKFFFEVYLSNEWKITVFGAGHVAQTLVPILLQTHCSVTCLDTRSDWIDRLSSHPRLKRIVAHDLTSHVEAIDSKSFILLMTQGHATDLPVLAKILSTREAPYLGVIGSLQKAKILRRNLAEQGLTEDKIESFYCPIGLPIGNNTPAEISISIVAQLIQERDRLQIVHHKTKDFPIVQRSN